VEGAFEENLAESTQREAELREDERPNSEDMDRTPGTAMPAGLVFPVLCGYRNHSLALSLLRITTSAILHSLIHHILFFLTDHSVSC
jgi:small-conductance mechanosensitive channel